MDIPTTPDYHLIRSVTPEPETPKAEPVKVKSSKKRKRKEREEEEKVDDIESRYISKLDKLIKKQNLSQPPQQLDTSVDTPAIAQPVSPPPAGEDVPDADEEIDPDLLQHETLTSESTAADKTLFISNLPVKVLTSKSALKSLKDVFSVHGRIDSIRFRSIAFTDLLPRKVAYITKKLHPERDTLNAYLVYRDGASVAAATGRLNGFFWEGKHLRVDSVAHPTVHLPPHTSPSARSWGQGLMCLGARS